MSLHHSMFPPSASARWLSCTASVGAIDALAVRDTGSEYAAEGTLAHQIFEEVLTHGSPQSFRAGETYTSGGYKILFPPEMLKFVEEAADYVHNLGVGPTLSEIKTRLPIFGADGEQIELITGTADVVKQVDADMATLHIADLKYGMGIQVFAENNTQLMIYAAGALAELDALLEGVEQVALHVVQPRLDHFDVWNISVTDLQKFVDDQISPAVRSILSGGTQFAPSDDACRWCPMAPCAAQAEWVDQQTQGWFDDRQTLVEDADIPDLGAVMDNFSLIEMFIKSCRSKAVTMLLGGDTVAGWKLVAGRSARAWSDAGDVETALLEAGAAPFQEAKISSVAQAEKELGKAKFAESDLFPLVVKNPGKPTLTAESDKRPAFTENADFLFDNEDDKEFLE